MHRVLKPTGSLYFHCDPRASHYLKLVLDAIFGHDRFLAEIIWKRTSAHSSAKRPGPVHDVLLVFTKTNNYVWNQQYQPYDSEYVEMFFEMKDLDGRRWKRMDLTGAGVRRGATGQPWRGINITARGRHWAYRPSQLDAFDKSGKIHWPQKANGMPRLKQYVDEMPGVPLQDVWTDIKPIHNLATERVGFQTQKPVALLERIIESSSNPGDVVLDPFCGCGTALVAARNLEQKRDCIGIDIAWVAIAVIRSRIPDIPVVNEPKERRALLELAHSENGGYKVQQWALQKVHAAPVGGGSVVKKGRDRGVDGVRFFTENGGFPERVLYSVKSGHVGPRDVRDLRAVIERDKAAIGVFITLQKPTPEMRREAVVAGSYTSKLFNRKYARLQIVTTDQLLSGVQPDIPLQLARAISPEAPALIDRRLIREASREAAEQLVLPVGPGSLDLIDKKIAADIKRKVDRRKRVIAALATASSSEGTRKITRTGL
jgi:DNA modification methylase